MRSHARAIVLDQWEDWVPARVFVMLYLLLNLWSMNEWSSKMSRCKPFQKLLWNADRMTEFWENGSESSHAYDPTNSRLWAKSGHQILKKEQQSLLEDLTRKQKEVCVLISSSDGWIWFSKFQCMCSLLETESLSSLDSKMWMTISESLPREHREAINNILSDPMGYINTDFLTFAVYFLVVLNHLETVISFWRMLAFLNCSGAKKTRKFRISVENNCKEESPQFTPLLLPSFRSSIQPLWLYRQ